MTTVRTLLGYLERIAEKLNLKQSVSYVFKLGCGCSVYQKSDIEAHLWANCENQGADFWCDRYTELGRTTKHHLRPEELESVYGNVEIGADELPALKLRQAELDSECVWKNVHHYVELLRESKTIEGAVLTLMEEANLAADIKKWYIREDLKPPEYELLHLLALAKLAVDSVILELEKGASRVLLFGELDDFF